MLVNTLFQLIPVAAAQNIGGVVNTVGSSFNRGFGDDFGEIAVNVASEFIPFLNVVAVLVIVVAGMLAIVAQDDGRINAARTVIAMTISGIILVNIAPALRDAYVTGLNFDGGASANDAAGIITDEVVGVISFIEVLAAILAVITIIVYGLKAIVNYDSESGASDFRKAIYSVLFGLILLVVKVVITNSIVSGTPDPVVAVVMNIVNSVLLFIALAAVVVICIAGIFMIVNIGNDEQYERAKKIIVRVAIGLVMITVVGSLVNILVDGIFGRVA